MFLFFLIIWFADAELKPRKGKITHQADAYSVLMRRDDLKIWERMKVRLEEEKVESGSVS